MSRALDTQPPRRQSAQVKAAADGVPYQVDNVCAAVIDELTQ
jgi:hypothetical protein